jgi:hypothetical protein
VGGREVGDGAQDPREARDREVGDGGGRGSGAAWRLDSRREVAAWRRARDPRV